MVIFQLLKEDVSVAQLILRFLWKNADYLVFTFLLLYVNANVLMYVQTQKEIYMNLNPKKAAVVKFQKNVLLINSGINQYVNVDAF